MKWTVTIPRTIAEDDKLSVEVEADTIEEAITTASPLLSHRGCAPSVGQVFNVHARVKVCKVPLLPLKSV